jgi:hypothetical protein
MYWMLDTSVALLPTPYSLLLTPFLPTPSSPTPNFMYNNVDVMQP